MSTHLSRLEAIRDQLLFATALSPEQAQALLREAAEHPSLEQRTDSKTRKPTLIQSHCLEHNLTLGALTHALRVCAMPEHIKDLVRDGTLGLSTAQRIANGPVWAQTRAIEVARNRRLQSQTFIVGRPPMPLHGPKTTSAKSETVIPPKPTEKLEQPRNPVTHYSFEDYERLGQTLLEESGCDAKQLRQLAQTVTRHDKYLKTRGQNNGKHAQKLVLFRALLTKYDITAGRVNTTCQFLRLPEDLKRGLREHRIGRGEALRVARLAEAHQRQAIQTLMRRPVNSKRWGDNNKPRGPRRIRKDLSFYSDLLSSAQALTHWSPEAILRASRWKALPSALKPQATAPVGQAQKNHELLVRHCREQDTTISRLQTACHIASLQPILKSALEQKHLSITKALNIANRSPAARDQAIAALQMHGGAQKRFQPLLSPSVLCHAPTPHGLNSVQLQADSTLDAGAVTSDRDIAATTAF